MTERRTPRPGTGHTHDGDTPLDPALEPPDDPEPPDDEEPWQDGDTAALGGLDPRRPTAARLYDCLLYGKDNFAVDRAAVTQLIARAPEVLDSARANRAFHSRAVGWLAARGIRQFIDIGCGLPTVHPAMPSTYQTARRVRPDVHVAYVDHDPQVLTFARALLAGDDDAIAVVAADLRDPDSLLADPGLRGVIDLSEPAGLLLTAVLHFVPDADDPHGLVERYLSTLAPGSYLVVSHATSDQVPAETVTAAQEACADAAERLTIRTRAQIERFFRGLEIVPPYPGAPATLTPVGRWSAAGPQRADPSCSRLLLAAVARKP